MYNNFYNFNFLPETYIYKSIGMVFYTIEWVELC